MSKRGRKRDDALLEFNSQMKHSTIKNSIENLRAYQIKKQIISSIIKRLKRAFKRVSPCFLLEYKETQGSITVEAALALPFFLFFIVNLLSLIMVFSTFSTNLEQLHQETKLISVYAHSTGNSGNEMVIQNRIVTMKPVISVIGFKPAQTLVQCKVRKWTGYDVTRRDNENKEEEWVYITPFGSAYHRKRTCNYLNLKLHCEGIQNIGLLRNMDGGKYYACERCGKGGYSGIVFYTEQGNRYHFDLNCSSLKRTVRTVPISQVGDRHACSKCSK